MTDTKNTVSDELLAEMLAGLEGVTPGPWYHVKGRGPHHLGWEVGAPNDGISVSKKAEVSAHIARCSPDTMRSILTELQSLRASIPGGVGVKVISVDEVEKIILETEPSQLSDRGDKIWTRRMATALAERLSALDHSPAEAGNCEDCGEVGYSCYCYLNDDPPCAAPSNPVISDEMVERVFQAVAPHIAGTDWREVRAAITVALSQPQSGETK